MREILFRGKRLDNKREGGFSLPSLPRTQSIQAQ